MSIIKTYFTDSKRIDTFFTYGIKLRKEEGVQKLVIIQLETKHSVEIILSELLNEIFDVREFLNKAGNFGFSFVFDISVMEIGFVCLDLLFFIGRKLGHKYLKIHTDSRQRSELDWVKDIIPTTVSSYDNRKLAYIVRQDLMSQMIYYKFWLDKFQEFKEALWTNYREDIYMRKVLSGDLLLDMNHGSNYSQNSCKILEFKEIRN